MQQLLIHYAPFLIHLEVGYINPSFEAPSTSFPKLRSLVFERGSDICKFFEFFANSCLKMLVLDYFTEKVGTYLKTATNLKELTIRNGTTAAMRDVSGLCNCSLTKLDIEYSWETANIITLLNAQATTLTSFGSIYDLEVFESIMTMPAMKHIKFAYKMPTYNNDRMDKILPNQNIETARIGAWGTFGVHRLFVLLPNLKQVQLWHVSQQTLNH